MMFTDPGHGWCRVRRSEKIFQSVAHLISGCSYQRGDYVYLEEDCDLAEYYKAIVAKGYEIEWKCNHTDKTSKIRGYESYRNY